MCSCLNVTVSKSAGAVSTSIEPSSPVITSSAPADFESVKASLESAGLKPELAEVTMRAETPVVLTGDDAERMQKLLDVLEDLDDVQAVHHNAEIE